MVFSQLQLDIERKCVCERQRRNERQKQWERETRIGKEMEGDGNKKGQPELLTQKYEYKLKDEASERERQKERKILIYREIDR